jgi:hypothetical protein
MKTIIDKNTGRVLYGSVADVVPFADEMVVDGGVADSLRMAFYNFETRTFYEGQVLTEEQIASEIRKEQMEGIKAKYQQHRLNGWNAYQDFRAMIVVDIYSGKITETQAFLIENDLKVAYDRIAQNGDWKTAYFELSQKTVSYPFIQAYMDIALNFILNYIQTNYDS